MLSVTRHAIGADFAQSARAACRAAFEKDNEPPNAVFVRPGTSDLALLVVGLGNPPLIHQIRIEVRDEVNSPPEGYFEIDVSHGTLESVITGARPAVNHIGFRFPDVEALEAFRLALEAVGLIGYEAPAEDHLARWYIPLPGPDGKMTGLSLELQVLEGAISNAHIEVGAPNPLEFLASLGGQVVDFGPGSPRGMCKFPGTVITIHASGVGQDEIQRVPGK